MKKILITLLILAQGLILAESKPKATAVQPQKKTETKAAVKKDEIKKFKTLKEAADDYAKVMQEISNYGSREMLKTINVDVDKYVSARGDQELAKKWEDTNTMLLEQFEVSVYKINEHGNLGDVVFLIRGYNENALSKYLNDNLDKYAKINKGKSEVEIDIEAYINLQYEYLLNTGKINIATSTVNFVKTGNEWKVVEEKAKK
ncbi:MAG: hypothetical protein Q4D53_05945 [Leptotrichiaceae bacterium]|nr:hypothetical protein [Leptotrichiaceae bacterium]